ncbi:hypothetical protein KF840_19345 [bacterium]|nr:hypothetical protein [bacterium]
MGVSSYREGARLVAFDNDSATPILLPGFPRLIAKSRDETRLLVSVEIPRETGEFDHGVVAVDTRLNAVIASVLVAHEVMAIVFSPDGKSAYAAARVGDSGGEMIMLDVATLTIIGPSVSLGTTARPESIAVSPDGTQAYVGVKGAGGAVAIIDLGTHQLIDSIRTPMLTSDSTYVENAMIGSDGTLYIAFRDDTHAAIGVLEPGVNRIDAIIPVCSAEDSPTRSVFGLLESTSQNRLYAMCSRVVDVINLSTDRVLISVPGIVDPANGSFDQSPDGRFVFGLKNCDGGARCEGGSRVVAIDTKTNTVRGEIGAGDFTARLWGLTVAGFPCSGGQKLSTATATASPTPRVVQTSAATNTATPDVHPSETQSPNASPTRRPEPSRCVGDCDGDGSVVVSELVRAVGIALGQAGLAICSAADQNEDGAVTVNELVAAVGAALNGCGP